MSTRTTPKTDNNRNKQVSITSSVPNSRRLIVADWQSENTRKTHSKTPQHCVMSVRFTTSLRKIVGGYEWMRSKTAYLNKKLERRKIHGHSGLTLTTDLVSYDYQVNWLTTEIRILFRPLSNSLNWSDCPQRREMQTKNLLMHLTIHALYSAR